MKSTLILATIVVAASTFISFSEPLPRILKRGGEDPVGTVYVVVDKSDYELKVFDDEGWYATYPVVFGSKDLSDKMMEGDKRTPEGNFKIISKRPHEKWHKMLMLDYPNETDRARAHPDLDGRPRAQVGGDRAGQGAAPFEPAPGLVVAGGNAVERHRVAAIHGPGPYVGACRRDADPSSRVVSDVPARARTSRARWGWSA